MAVYVRRAARDEEDESVFISMTDIMISLLFIVIILMAFFAMQMRTAEPEQTISLSIHEIEVGKRDVMISILSEENRRLRQERQNALDKFLAGISKRKQLIMNVIAEKIREVAKIQVHVDHRQGVIRFDNRDLFGSGQWKVNDRSSEIMMVIADAIVKTLPCFTTGSQSRFAESCNPEFAIIDAIQIEGHTDDQPTSTLLRTEYINDNLELSVRRATSTYRTMVAHRPELKQFENAEDPAQPVLSVSGYGETRPIAENDTDAGRELNRRIDLRFIMMTPQSLKEIENFKNRLLFEAQNKEIAR